MTTYDPELTARLIAEAKEDDARMTRAPWGGEPESPTSGFRRVYSGGLDGPGETVAQWMLPANSDGIVRQRSNLRAMADQLEAARARIAALETDRASMMEDLAHVRRVVADAREAMVEGGAWGHESLTDAANRLRAELETANTARALAESRSNNLDSSHAKRDATKLRISDRLGLPATATQSEIADRVDEVVGERDAAWRSGVEASIRRLDLMSRKPRDLWHPAFFAAVDEALVHLRAMLERGTEKSGDSVMEGEHGGQR